MMVGSGHPVDLAVRPGDIAIRARSHAIAHAALLKLLRNVWLADSSSAGTQDDVLADAKLHNALNTPADPTTVQNNQPCFVKHPAARRHWVLDCDGHSRGVTQE
jgi:hypothetical protein